MSGITNVVDPSPDPHVVPIAVNRFAYAVLDIVAPLAFIHPVGTVVLAKNIMLPVGARKFCAV
jgi:hypothetical protein